MFVRLTGASKCARVSLAKWLTFAVAARNGTTCPRFRELRDSHNKAMEDTAAAVKEKEQAHAQEMIDLERKLLTDKGNLQKVNQSDRESGGSDRFIGGRLVLTQPPFEDVVGMWYQHLTPAIYFRPDRPRLPPHGRTWSA